MAHLLLALCLLGVLHTYVLYPRWMRRQLRPGRRAPQPERWPAVSALMAVHNEEAVLEDKLLTLRAQDYPGPLTVHVGSDNSSDGTNDILGRYPEFETVFFRQRQGKPSIVNQLAARAGGEVLLITDASVMLRPDTVRALVRPLAVDPSVGVVDGKVVHTGVRRRGISGVEDRYIGGEVRLKQAESDWGGVMMGPFGGCFALRAAAFRPIPDTFLVDDFYLCMRAFEQGLRAVHAGEGVVEESVGQDVRGEFRRKVRIGSGNWQNMVRFRKLWWPPWRDKLAFAFFSHKVLRWWTPLLMLVGALAMAAISLPLMLSVTSVLLGLAALDRLTQYLGLHLQPLRALTYFLSMNAALLVGAYRYLTGIKTNVWQPSARH